MSSLDPNTEDTLRAVFAGADDAVGVSHHNVVRLVNPPLVRLFGYDHESELVGRSFFDLISPEGRAALASYVQRRAENRPVPGLYRTEGLRRDGERFGVEIRTTRFELGGEAFAFAIIREIRRESWSEDLYEAIFERNTAVKLLIDPTDGRIVDANPAAVEFYGWSRRELASMSISDINLLPPARIARELTSARRGERTRFRFRHRTASAEVRQVEVHTGTIEVGGRSLLLSIVQDVSDQDALEAQLREAQKLEAVGRLAGGVAHDFNNLLTVMMTAGDLLRRELPITSGARGLVDDLMLAAGRASELTRQLLAVGRAQPRHPVVVDLGEVVRRLERLITSAAGADATVSWSIEPRQTVEADPGQLEQVVMNLVLNARDATGGRGRIDVAVRGVADDPELGPAVELVVRDDGPGMDPETRARVFEPFFSTKPAGRGSGLGLASVYGIVRQSGGRVTVESEAGRGATFRVALPFRLRGAPSIPPEVSPRVVTGRILLIDDDPEVLDVLGDSLRAHGYRVVPAASGEAALALTDDELAEFDLVVTDYRMPGRVGTEVAAALIGRRASLKVIVISGHLPEVDRRSLPRAVSFLEKPFTGTVLAERVRAALLT
ncbi:MAG: PAS domain S-box protein [Myxococcota bacterium]